MHRRIAGLLFATALAWPAVASAASQEIPDFSGIWAHLTLPGFEQPASGPGPVKNRSRSPNGVGNFNQLVGDYTNPILKPEAAEIVKKHGELSVAGKGYPTPSGECWPGGVPYLFWNIEMQMFQKSDEITMTYIVDHLVRHIRLNANHPAQVTPSLQGDSVGHYEGDTLVIDTVGIKADPFNMLDMYGTPYSKALHVVERYRFVDYETAKAAAERDEKDNLRLADGRNDLATAVDLNYKGKGLQLEFTVEDPATFTMPWTGVITYRRAANPWIEHVCAENLNEYYNNRAVDVPAAAKPDF